MSAITPQRSLPPIQDPYQRSALLRQVIDQIWSTSDLKSVLQLAVDQIAEFLQLDRCSFLWCYHHTQQVQVVCEQTRGGHSASCLGYYPLESFGNAASAIAQGELVVACGPVDNPGAMNAIARWMSMWQNARPPAGTSLHHSTVERNVTVFDAIANLLVPVKNQEGWIGFIACLSDQPHTWTTAEVEFVQLIAQQLEIAIRQAQLYEQTQKQAQRERLVNQITNQTRQSFDLKIILTQAIAQLLEALGSDRCLVHLVEDEQPKRCHKTPEEKHACQSEFCDHFWEKTDDIAFRRQHLFEVCREPFTASVDDFDTHGPITQWVIHNRQPVIIPDVRQDPRIGPDNREYIEASIKSSLVMPVQANGKLHAILYLNQCSHIRYWSKQDRELAQAVADQLAISIQQARLYAQAHASMEREALLRLVGEHIRRTLDLKTILQTIVREVRHLLSTDRAVIYQFTEAGNGQVVVEDLQGNWVSLLAEIEPDPAFVRDCCNYLPHYQQGEVRVINDVCHAGLDAAHLACWQRWQVHAGLIVPILIGANVWGLLIVNECAETRNWKHSEIDFLQQLADQMAIAIHQAELYQQTQAAAISAEAKAQELEQTLLKLQQTQSQLIQSEKMSSLGQLVAGVAHEINNPVNFIYGNLSHTHYYTQDLLKLVQLYQKHYRHPAPEIQDYQDSIDLEFLIEDLPKMLASMKIGADRIREIVQSLKNFSRVDQAPTKFVNLHEGIDSTLLILQNRIKYAGIEVIKNYGELSQVECYAGQMNQVFMNILSNAIDALESIGLKPPVTLLANPKTSSKERSRIIITTEMRDPNYVTVRIADNGSGMTETVKNRLFDPFFTTKPVGKGTGLGLSISYQIVVERHGGKFWCVSEPGQGSEFWIQIPVHQGKRHAVISPEKSTSDLISAAFV